MKKALGWLAVLGGAAAVVAYTIKKEEAKREEDFSNMEEEDISERILKAAEECQFMEEGTEKPASTTTTYPHLAEEDMLFLNEISEEAFAQMDETDTREERPLQHTIVFEEEGFLEEYKNIVINEGFVVTSGEQEKELVVLNIVAANPDAILQKVFHLADLAKAHHGKYVKWILK